MNGIVTRHYLRQRFWIATFVLLAAIAGSAGILILMAGAQADRGNYLVAFHHLNNATIRLERELARLSVVPESEDTDRREVRSAFAGLLADFRAISASASTDSTVLATGSAGSPVENYAPGDQTAALAEEFGVDTATAMARLRIGAGLMPETIAEIWRSNASASRSTAPLALESALSCLLRLAAPLVRGEGRFSSAERRHHLEIGRLAYGRIQPTLTRVEKALDTEGDRLAHRSILFVLALSGAGFAAALFNFAAILRPLINTVMASQAEILAERDKAMAARQAKQNFLSVVSHDLRTPMNGVLGFASLLIASDLKPEHRKQVEIIQSSGKAMLALVNDLLDLSKIEAGSLELADESFSVEAVISEVVALLRGGADEKRLEMSVKFDSRLPGESYGDGNRLRQVLTNLVANAIKFTDSGRIDIEARAESGAQGPAGSCVLILAISDTGIGIPVDKTETIFERFTQIDHSTGRKFEGTGLGLSICKQIVEKMGGRIWAESMPGTGSTFFVRIPLAASVPMLAGYDADDVQAMAGKPVNRGVFPPAPGLGGWRVERAVSRP
jgi:signal transduction histidine kinase